ncbi:MAG: single-stranded DNA-binding protein [Patescibacteria group bacterium]|nr:single-stranded DNA-binding protein [Patescibacteria group bacterium]MDE2116855.1 single-stranded DNA-binding protein [Patescibacteria group bacterium]
MYLNKAFIVGNLTRDPELRALPSGMQVASLSVATNSVWRDKDGNKKEDTQFHNIVVFGRQAETSAQYLKKGQQVMVEGRIQTRSWDDKTSGEKKYRTEIVADRVQFGAKSGASAGGSFAGAPDATAEGAAPAKSKGAKAAAVDTIEYPSEDINPEDIPF